MESFVVGIFPFLFFLIIAFIAISVNFYIAKQRREKMEDLAKELGLEFQASDGEKAVLNQMGQNGQTSSKPAGIFQLLLSVFSNWKIVGNYGDDFVEIYTESRGSGKSRTVYTIIFMGAKQPLPYKLEITNQGMIEGFFIKLFKMEDIQVGDEKFDKAFVIKGDNQAAIKNLCLNPSVQKSIYELMNEEGFRILHNGIYFEKQGIITDSPFFKQKLGKMNTVCSKIYSNESTF